MTTPTFHISSYPDREPCTRPTSGDSARSVSLIFTPGRGGRPTNVSVFYSQYVDWQTAADLMEQAAAYIRANTTAP